MALLKGTLTHPQYEAVVVVDTLKGVVSCDEPLRGWLAPGRVRVNRVAVDPKMQPEAWLRGLQTQFRGQAQMRVEEVAK